MPRGVSPLDEARLQGRLWLPALLGAPRHTFVFDAALPQCSSVESNGKVSSIQDAFGRTGSFVQATDARRPAYASAVGSDQASLKFSSSGQNNLDSSNVFFSGAFQSLLVVLRSANPSVGGEIVFDTGGDRRILEIINTTGQLRMTRSAQITSPVASIFGWQAAAIVLNGSSSFISVNGNLATGPQSTSTASSSAPYRLGSRFSTPSAQQWFNGNLATLVHFNGVWTADEVALLQGFFAWNGGFQDTLTPAHPFRNRPPLIGG
jgi:hypothetical protein